MAFLRKERCFRLAPINGGSDSTYRVAAAITQFAGGSKSTSVLIVCVYGLVRQPIQIPGVVQKDTHVHAVRMFCANLLAPTHTTHTHTLAVLS